MPKTDRQPNTLLRRARGTRSQQQLADLANAEIQRATGHAGAVTAKAVSDWERGWYAWPTKPTRDALCAVLGMAAPAELGFRSQRAPVRPPANDGPRETTIVLGSDHGQETGGMRRRAFILGVGATAASSPAVGQLTVGASDPHGFATTVTERWPDASVGRAFPDRGSDWSLGLPSGRSFDGVDVSVQVHRDIGPAGRAAVVDPPRRRLGEFTRPNRRGLLVAADDHADVDAYYAVDARAAQHNRQRESDALQVPRAYLLDDLTFGVMWATTNLDDTQLSDDAPLHHYRTDLAHYEGQSDSVANRDEAPDLGTVSQLWLGSEFCARHILRNLDRLSVPPLFWTREQRGEEEASVWLLWRHKLAYLRKTSRLGGALARGFCLPEELVDASPRYERVLLLLSAALMEASGIRTCVTTDPHDSEVEGFVHGGAVIVANWIRTPGLWHVDSSTQPTRLADYDETAGHIAAHSVIDARTPAQRMRRLADYLRIPWPWFRHRCGELGEQGFDQLTPPRSRLLTVDGLNVAARYVGRLTKA